MVALSIPIGIATGGVAYFVPWLPSADSREAGAIDGVYWFVAIICVVIFAIVAGVTIYAGWKFRARPDDDEDGSPIHGHTGLEIVWTAIPTVLVTAISVYSALVLYDIERLPPDHRTIEVSTMQFAWSFGYPELETTQGELVLVKDETVELVLTSADVIHSFWVPEWRIKKDAVPGIETRTVVTPTREGVYAVICTELCGLGHSKMRARARVVSQEEFDAWAEEQQAGVDEVAGEGAADGRAIFEAQGCGSCHALADAGTTAEVGPDLDRVLPDRDEEHVRRSIVDPEAEITEGFQPGVMPGDYEERLTDEQLDALVGYLIEATGGR